ncbi:MAG: hypothetical protein WD066_09250 [Planctomycetaceae bacterium]
MDARSARCAFALLTLIFAAGAVHKTPNFVVHAPSDRIAVQIGTLAEEFRDELAVEWLGKKLPRWAKSCEIHVEVGDQLGAGGATSFAFDRDHKGEMQVFGWTMRIQGSLERICDSVLPHEVSHTILACHFRRPLPRWADEGAATLVEHDSEQRRQRRLLEEVLKTGRRIPLRKLFAMTEYPQDMRDVMTLYAQGYSIADYLVQQGGKRKYLDFIESAHHDGWDHALQHHYGLGNVDRFERRWNGWVLAGSPPLERPDGSMLADANDSRGLVVRGQNPEASAKGGSATRPTRSQPASRGFAQPTRPRDAPNTTQAPSNEGWVPVAASRRVRPVPRDDVPEFADGGSFDLPRQRRAAEPLDFPSR